MKRIFSLTILSLIISYSLAYSPAYSKPIMPVSYEMLNGGKDTWAYWDGSYPSPNSHTSYAWLSGGLGDLTDGIIASGSFYTVENLAGTGPYVGWDVRAIGFHPTITFNFSGPVNIDGISLHVDNANSGRVSLPLSVQISMGGSVQNFGIAFDNDNLAPRWLDFNGLCLYGSSLALTLYDRSYVYDWPTDYSTGWVMLSEVTFDGGAAVPESSTMLLLGVGLVGLAGFWKMRG